MKIHSRPLPRNPVRVDPRRSSSGRTRSEMLASTTVESAWSRRRAGPLRRTVASACQQQSGGLDPALSLCAKAAALHPDARPSSRSSARCAVGRGIVDLERQRNTPAMAMRPTSLSQRHSRPHRTQVRCGPPDTGTLEPRARRCRGSEPARAVRATECRLPRRRPPAGRCASDTASARQSRRARRAPAAATTPQRALPPPSPVPAPHHSPLLPHCSKSWHSVPPAASRRSRVRCCWLGCHPSASPLAPRTARR